MVFQNGVDGTIADVNGFAAGMAEGFVFGRAGLINWLKWAEVVALHGSHYLSGEDVIAEGSVGHDGYSIAW